MKRIINAIMAAVFASALMLACTKDDVGPIGTNDKNTVTLEFDNRVGAQKMALGTTNYKNASGEEFTLTRFNYFISNVALKKADGTVVKFPDQYFLIRQSDPTSWEPELTDVPAADYNEISFTIGVDSTRSVSDISARTGVLDPTSYGDDGMYWSWNSGYIFVKMEGTSPVVPLNSAGKRAFELHIGGYGGREAVAPNNLRSVTLPLNGTAMVRKDIAPTIHLVADFMKVFDGPNTIKLAETNSVHNPAVAGPIADNYMKMFVVDHVHND
jgi:hypothetical protein